MPYSITSYTKRKAKQLGVKVVPSANRKKKIDVYRGGAKIASVGAIGYPDYPTYLKTHGKNIAETRRRQYKQRHSQNRNKVGSNGYFADKLLW
jgi:hypothetical protein